MNAGDTHTIVSWHAHVYFVSAAQREVAEHMRQRIGERFVVQLGRWHAVPVGPHTAAMYQVAFTRDVFDALVPWLALNHAGLSVLVHPNTLHPRADHLQHALWLGPQLALLEDTLPEHIQAHEEDPVVPNTAPAGP